jgi:uncharacterized protein involved in response to NO
MGALHALVGFLAALTNADADGRIILDPPAAAAKFVLLNAAAHFRKVRSHIRNRAPRNYLSRLWPCIAFGKGMVSRLQPEL